MTVKLCHRNVCYAPASADREAAEAGSNGVRQPVTDRTERIVGELESFIDGLLAVDHHCHGVVRGELGAAEFDDLLTESERPQPPGGNVFDAPVGVMLRTLCAPLLGLEPHVSGADYLSRRGELGASEVNRILLAAAGIDTYVVDTGFRSAGLTDPAELAGITAARSAEIVRLEAVAEALAEAGTGAAGFMDAFATELASRLQRAVGVKSIIAYRYGLDFDPARPEAAAVRRAAGEWLRQGQEKGKFRMDNEVLLRAILWAAVDAGKPIQVHVGYGDTDITMHRCDPTQMTEFLRATMNSGPAITLLHNYPFIREAGFLAQVYPHVYFDTGAVLHFTGPSYLTAVRESLELAPFSKLLFSTDAFGLAEFYTCGAHLQRRGLARVFGEWLAAGAISADDTRRYLEMIMGGNACRVYGLESQ